MTLIILGSLFVFFMVIGIPISFSVGIASVVATLVMTRRVISIVTRG